MIDDTLILPGPSPVCGLDIHARFDGGQMSSNGGALLLREAGRGFRFGEMLSECIPDKRDLTKVVRSYSSMIDARVVAIACGHEDCDDHDTYAEANVDQTGRDFSLEDVTKWFDHNDKHRLYDD